MLGMCDCCQDLGRTEVPPSCWLQCHSSTMALLRSEVMVSEGPQEKQATILGAGSFGTALAVHLARAGHSVRLWARDPALAEAITERRSNPTYLPELILPENVCATSDLDRALGGAHPVARALPSHGPRAVMTPA